MIRSILFAAAVVAVQGLSVLPANARAPSEDEQFRIAKAACQSFTTARISEESATGVQGAGPKGDDALRWLVEHSDSDINLAVADTRSVDTQLNGNARANALPVARVVHRQAAELFCFAENVLRVRSQGGAAPATTRGASPPPATVTASIDPAISTAIQQADEAASGALQGALEPSPLGLQGMPAEAFPDPRGKPADHPLEPVVNVRYLGLTCMKIKNRPWEINSENNWNSEFTLENECGFGVLLRVDTAERDEGEDGYHSYTPNGGLVAVGIPNWQWPNDVPLPFSWTPAWRRGEGAEWRSFTSPKLYLVSTHVPRRYIDVFIYACPLEDQATGRRNSMWIEQQRLMDEGKRTCEPGPPAK